MEGSPLILISHDLIRLLSSRTCLLTTQVPSYSLLPCVVLLFTHILVMLSLSSLLLRKRVSSVWKKKMKMLDILASPGDVSKDRR